MASIKEIIDAIQEDVRNLRDSANHVCQADEENGGAGGYCSCEEYDRVIDKLEIMKGGK